MSTRLFTVVLNEETKEVSYIGSMPAEIALQVVQNIVISEAVKKAQEEKAKEAKDAG